MTPLLVSSVPSRRALIAIADPQRRAELAARLRQDGWHVRASGGGAELLDWLWDACEGGREREPDAVILQLELPGCSGVSLARGLRDLGWRSRFVVVSGAGSRADADVPVYSLADLDPVLEAVRQSSSVATTGRWSEGSSDDGSGVESVIGATGAPRQSSSPA